MAKTTKFAELKLPVLNFAEQNFMTITYKCGGDGGKLQLSNPV
jgi:hypothetical protein